ncbi:MAG: CoA transferase [Rhodospirillales bacterium]|nr:CoA transferase [Rhodospirillales bacterium]
MQDNSGPLAGIRVIELAHVMAGPVCGLMLADMGADVIKVEKLPGGDDTRRFLPPDIKGESAAYMMMNRNKRGIAVDLKNPDGRACVTDMLKTADVVIENYRAGTMERLGLGYQALQEINPGLIYCEISGFGRTGPYKDRGGYDLIAQGMSGLMSITGEGPGRDLVKVGAPVTDITAGILAATGVLAAYIHRLKTGYGQRVDTSLFEAGITHTYWQSAIAFATGKAPGPLGSAHPLNAPYQAFETADGWITVGAANQANWLRLLDVLARPDLAADARYTDSRARMDNLSSLSQTLAEIFKTRGKEDWLARLEQAGVPAGPVLDVLEMQADPHALARQMIVEVDHDTAGTVKTLGCPIKFSETPASVRSAAPVYGQHTRAVLGEYGYDGPAIARLIRSGAVVCHEKDSQSID